jgi:ankyrin repeat protein
MKKGTVFLYQVFPNSIMFYHNFLIRACREKDFEAVQHLVEFFTPINPNFINLKESSTLNTAAHYASSLGYFAILLYLLENHADIRLRNKVGNTPLFMAALSLHRDCAKVKLVYPCFFFRVK